MASLWKIATPSLGFPAIDDVSTTAKVALGTEVRAVHPTSGAGTFVYLKGVGSTVEGSWVTYNADTFGTALIAPDAIGPVAVAMAATVADRYGWYQIDGQANAKAADVADSGKVYIDSAAGVCDDAVVVGDRVKRAKWTSVEDTDGYASVMVNRPFVDDQKDAT